MVKISAVIITFNEEKNIERCLLSLQGIADEIVVVDSFSTDNTEKLCLQYDVRFIRHPFGGYIEQKLWATGQATYDFILALDADEALSPKLSKSILKTKQGWDADGYTMNRLTNFCGKWIRHAWYPDAKLRLWDRRKGQWGGTNPHDKVIMQGNSLINRLEGDIFHFSYYSLDGFLRQQMKFAALSADALLRVGKRSSIRKIVINPAIAFLKLYIFKLGFLDGYEGFLISRTTAFSVFMKYAYLMDLQERKGKEEE